MADQNFMDLASKTASGITGTDYMMLVNNSEAYKALVNDVAEAILSKLTSKSFSGLETTAKNVIGALNELNSKIVPIYTEKSTVVRYPIHNGSRFLAVFAPMGEDGYNGSPITMFVVRVNYAATNCNLTPIYKPDHVALSAEISGSEVVITPTYNSDPVSFIRAIIIPIY